METNNALHVERESIQHRIVDCQQRYSRGERGTQLETEYNAAVAASKAFDAAHPEIKQEVLRGLREYHAKRQPFASRIK